jgi:hypothetical protein
MLRYLKLCFVCVHIVVLYHLFYFNTGENFSCDFPLSATSARCTGALSEERGKGKFSAFLIYALAQLLDGFQCSV